VAQHCRQHICLLHEGPGFGKDLALFLAWSAGCLETDVSLDVANYRVPGIMMSETLSREQTNKFIPSSPL